MIEATSCGGVVIFRGKILLLYKNFKNRYEGWVLPKGTVEAGEEYKDTALREVLEESGARASIIKYIGRSEYTFNVPEDTVDKEVHWYLMMADSYYSKPQREEYFVDSGFYKYHEAYHLLKFANEKQILEKAYHEEKLGLEFVFWILYQGRSGKAKMEYQRVMRKYGSKVVRITNQRELDREKRRWIKH